jgi:hypothetical protein
MFDFLNRYIVVTMVMAKMWVKVMFNFLYIVVTMEITRLCVQYVRFPVKCQGVLFTTEHSH